MFLENMNHKGLVTIIITLAIFVPFVKTQQFTNSSISSSSTTFSVTSSGSLSSTQTTSSNSELESSTYTPTQTESTITQSYFQYATFTNDVTIVGDVEFGELRVESNVTVTLLNGNKYKFGGGMETRGNIIITKTFKTYPGVTVDLNAPFWFHDGSFTVLDSGANSASSIILTPYFFSVSGDLTFDLSRNSMGNVSLGVFVSGGSFSFASALINSELYSHKTKRASIGSMINNGQIVLTEGSVFVPSLLSGSGSVELDNGYIIFDSIASTDTNILYSGSGTVVVGADNHMGKPLPLEGFTGNYQLAVKGDIESLKYESSVLEALSSSGRHLEFEIGEDFYSEGFHLRPGKFSFAGRSFSVNYINYGEAPSNSTQPPTSTKHPTGPTSDTTRATTSVYTTTVTSGTTSTVWIISCVPTTDVQGNIHTITYTLPCPYTTTVTYSSCSMDKCTAITTTRTVTPSTTTRTKKKCTPSTKYIYIVKTSTVMSCPSDHCNFCLPTTTHSQSSIITSILSSLFNSTASQSASLPTLSTTFNESTYLSTSSTSLNETELVPIPSTQQRGTTTLSGFNQ